MFHKWPVLSSCHTFQWFLSILESQSSYYKVEACCNCCLKPWLQSLDNSKGFFWGGLGVLFVFYFSPLLHLLCEWNLNKLPQVVSRDAEWWSQECTSYRWIPYVSALWSNLSHHHFVRYHCYHCCWSHSQKWLAQDHLQNKSQGLLCEQQGLHQSHSVTFWITATGSLTHNTYVLLGWVQRQTICPKALKHIPCRVQKNGIRGWRVRKNLKTINWTDKVRWGKPDPLHILTLFISILHVVYTK